MRRLHDDEHAVDLAVVRRLLGRDLPHLADLPLGWAPTTGSSNALLELGDELLVRLPRRGDGDAAMEARWTPYLASLLPVAVPEVVWLGEPGEGFPARWSVVRRLRGRTPDADPTRPRARLAGQLGAVVAALRAAPVGPDALADPRLRWYRARPLAELAETVTAAIADCRRVDGLGLDLDAAARVWADTLELPAARREVAPRWLHGDLVAENLLADDPDDGRGERLAGVLDLGALAVGDPAVDLGAAWELFGGEDRAVFRARAGAAEDDWLIGRGWALAIGLITFPYYWRTMPRRCADRLVGVRSVLADAGR